MHTKYCTGLYIILTIISLFLIVVSCEDSYYVDISKITNIKGINAEIVINGGITSEKKYHEITLTKPILLDEHNNVDSISGAIVKMKIGDIYYEFIEEVIHPNINTQKRRKGTYVSIDSIKGIPKTIHTLIVDFSGKTYTASDSMVEVIPFDFSSIELPHKTGSVMMDTSGVYPTLALKLINFGADKTNIYNWYSRDTIFEVEDKIKASVYCFNIVDHQGLLSELYMRLSHPMDFWKYDKITVKKFSISQQYEDYLIAVFKETYWNTNLFSTVPANVATNISTGGLGYFYASDTYIQSISAKELFKIVD